MVDDKSSVDAELIKINEEAKKALNYLSVEWEDKEGTARVHVLRGLIKSLPGGANSDTCITVAAWGLVVAGYQPTEDRVSFLTRTIYRNPPQQLFLEPDLDRPTKSYLDKS